MTTQQIRQAEINRICGDDDHDWEAIWSHFDRLQQRIMADKTSREEFFAEEPDERLRFYEWIQTQAGEFSCYM